MMMEPHELNDYGMKVAKRLGVDDAVFVSLRGTEQMVTFANDSLTVAKRIDEEVFSVYLAKDGKRIVGGSSNADVDGLTKFVERLHKTLMNLETDPSYVPLPTAPIRLPGPGAFDARLGEAEKEVSEFAQRAIEAARAAGARRSAGAVEANLVSSYILTSNGTEGRDTASNILLNIRSFTEANASGHGLSCSADLGGFKPE